VLKIFSYAFTSYLGLIIALTKRTADHKYWILKIDVLHDVRFTSKSFLLFLNGRGPQRNQGCSGGRARGARSLTFFWWGSTLPYFLWKLVVYWW